LIPRQKEKPTKAAARWHGAQKRAFACPYGASPSTKIRSNFRNSVDGEGTFHSFVCWSASTNVDFLPDLAPFL